MKRKHKHESVIEICTLFFWRRCLKCGEEFRREYGWRCYYNPSRNPYLINPGLDIYLCQSCAPTKFDAEFLFIKYKEERLKLQIPPKEELGGNK